MFGLNIIFSLFFIFCVFLRYFRLYSLCHNKELRQKETALWRPLDAFCTGLIVFLPLFCGVLGSDISNGMSIFILIVQGGSAGIWFSIVGTGFFSKEEMKKYIEFLERGKKLDLLKEKSQFYRECENAGILNLNGSGNAQKATLIAKRLGLAEHLSNPRGLAELFKESKSAYTELHEKDSNNKLQKKKKEEEEECRNLKKYARFYGRDKRIEMLTDERAELLRRIQSLESGTYAVMASTQQKEKDWAFHGGLASGIAGGAAGLAVAMEKQRENAQIRAQNEANRAAFAPLTLTAMEAISRYRDQVESLDKEIDKSAIKLVDSTSPQKCFDSLVFSETEITVSETGTCTVTTKMNLKEEIFMYDTENQAAVDGTVLAHIYKGEEKIGSATMVLPARGIVYSKYGNDTIVGMSLFSGKEGETYSVKFEPDRLWFIEV